jgi:hypothetical protein
VARLARQLRRPNGHAIRRQRLDRGVAFARDDGDEIAEASRACATGWRPGRGRPPPATRRRPCWGSWRSLPQLSTPQRCKLVTPKKISRDCHVFGRHQAIVTLSFYHNGAVLVQRWRDSHAHEQQVSHEQQPCPLHVLRRAVSSSRWPRRVLANVDRGSLLFRVLCGGRGGGALQKVPCHGAHIAGSLVTVRPPRRLGSRTNTVRVLSISVCTRAFSD